MNALSWLNPGRWLLYLALVAALAVGYTAWREHQRELGREEVRQQFAREAQAADARRQVITQYVDRDVVRVVEKIAVVTETIIKEVPIYVPSDAPDLPAGWRLLHDAAARGQVPDPAALAHAAPVAADAAAATLTKNYGQCREAAARLIGLQEWIRLQQQAN